MELAAGTESTMIGTETWERNGMVFFPDACFYEFIPEEETRRNLRDPDYTPRACLMDGVRQGESYELVLSVLHGGAFMRYRIGDVYRCVSAESGKLPASPSWTGCPTSSTSRASPASPPPPCRRSSASAAWSWGTGC